MFDLKWGQIRGGVHYSHSRTTIPKKSHPLKKKTGHRARFRAGRKKIGKTTSWPLGDMNIRGEMTMLFGGGEKNKTSKTTKGERHGIQNNFRARSHAEIGASVTCRKKNARTY